MKVKLTKLRNGAQLLMVPMSGSQSVTVQVTFAAGSKYETKKENGLAHFLEHMFFKGTARRPSSQAISKLMDGVGGEFNAFTGKETVAYYVKVDKTHLGLGIDVLSDMLMNSLFLSEEINREKGVILEEMNMYQDNPMRYVGDLFEQLLYGDQPAGRLIMGTKGNITSFKRNDFVTYLDKHYRASNMVITVAGGFNADKVKKSVESLFKKFPCGTVKPKPKVKEAQKQPQVLLQYKKSDQAHLICGVRTYPIAHKTRYAQALLATILGGNMSSRLFTHMRDREGLGYYVRTDAEMSTDTGVLGTHTGVDTSRVERAISIILEEYKRVRDELVSEEELERAREFVKGKILLSWEASEQVANHFVHELLLTGQVASQEQLFRAIDGVSREDIHKLARAIFRNDRLNMAIIGPYRDRTKFKKILSL